MLIPSARPALEIGSRLFTDLDNLKQIHGAYNGSSQRSSLREPATNTGYLPGGNGLKIEAVETYVVTAAGNEAIACRSDNDVTIRSSTAFTNPVYFGGMSNSGFPVCLNSIGRNSARINWTPTAAKYIGFDSGGGTCVGSIAMFGYLT